jgi:hypothetical protein
VGVPGAYVLPSVDGRDHGDVATSMVSVDLCWGPSSSEDPQKHD